MNQPDPISIPNRDDDATSASFSSDSPPPTTITISQGGARHVSANDVTIRQGGVVGVKSSNLTMSMGGIVGAQTNTASLTASKALGILASGEVALDQSGAGLLVAAGDVRMDQCGAGAVIAREVKADKSSAVFLVAGKVTGDVNTVFGTRESLTFAAVAGAIAGLTLAGLAIARDWKAR